MLSRFRSPPLTPGTKSLPTLVLNADCKPREVATSETTAETLDPEASSLVLARAAISRVSWTVSVGKWTSISARYEHVPLETLLRVSPSPIPGAC